MTKEARMRNTLRIVGLLSLIWVPVLMTLAFLACEPSSPHEKPKPCRDAYFGPENTHASCHTDAALEVHDGYLLCRCVHIEEGANG